MKYIGITIAVCIAACTTSSSDDGNLFDFKISATCGPADGGNVQVQSYSFTGCYATNDAQDDGIAGGAQAGAVASLTLGDAQRENAIPGAGSDYCYNFSMSYGPRYESCEIVPAVIGR